MNSIEVKNMNIFIELNGVNTFLVGNRGKTYLLKKLINKVDNHDILIDNKCIKEYDIDYLKKNIAVVLNDNTFSCDYVIDEIEHYANKLDIKKDIKEILKYFKISKIKNKEILTLSTKYRMYIKIISLLIINPKILGIDGLYEYLDSDMKSLINNYAKENKISLLNVISNLDNLNIDNIIVLNNGEALYCGNILSLLKGNSILPYLGYKLPFIVDLTQNLVLYNILDQVYTDPKKVVDKLWN